jgi:hypothetical protein
MLIPKSEVWTGGAVDHAPGEPSAAEGERRLMIAVLLHALRGVYRDAERPGRGALRRLRQDLGWLRSDDRSDVFAFERICESIGVDAERIRRRVIGELGPVLQLVDAPPSRRRRAPVPIRPRDLGEPTRVAS